MFSGRLIAPTGAIVISASLACFSLCSPAVRHLWPPVVRFATFRFPALVDLHVRDLPSCSLAKGYQRIRKLRKLYIAIVISTITAVQPGIIITA